MRSEPKGKLDALNHRRRLRSAKGLMGRTTGGRDPRLARDRLACGGGGRTASAAADLHGIAGGDLKRSGTAEADAAFRANTLLSVRRVTQVNAGRATAGVDGQVVLTGQAKLELADWVQHSSEPWQARPVKRVYIREHGKAAARYPGDRDRVFQARVVNALEPEWEARFEPRSYGFRPAVAARTRSRRSTRWARASAHAAGGYSTRTWHRRSNRIGHTQLLDQLGAFPARELVADWLRAGVVEDGRFTPTEQGTPQGGGATRKAHVVSGHVGWRCG